MKKLSVIVPVYKTERYLGQCIESILTQTYADIELILIDDGSPDNCGRLCDQYALQDDRIIVIHKNNSGVSAARNQGLDIASGEYLTFVDSDDWIEPDMYEQMMKKANDYDCDVVICDCVKEYVDHSEVYTHDIRPGFYDYEQLKREYYPHLLMMENVEYPATISNWLIMYRIRQSDNLYPNGNVRYLEGVRYSEDLLFGAELMLHARSLYYMKGSCLYHYRSNPLSASHTFKADKWDDYMMLYAAAINRLQKDDYDFSEQLQKMLLFFLYNAGGEVIESEKIKAIKKIQILSQMLNAPEVRKMFSKLSIKNLPISSKLKMVTLFYKYKWIYLWCLYCSIITVCRKFGK